ncbi:MAG: SDR family oxidoreductase [Candidatus Auribacter fodinae]|jgi:NAD(P)-dependent dehydrogenase (short-subunit alcohol dehydrogenase family)|uniref:SDR family oxidoreductase n=1 Tax=Candidatus Auribacter fodinae TaxID=2093366 RepID=A0A3A4QVW8_9BACT|nr:MAG: SDR family oxidoreductase [Candidatus Auribacter fodinae]
MKGTALITGGAKRIGREVALSLAKNGYNIAITYNHSRQDALGVCNAIRDIGQRAQAFQCDFLDKNAVFSLIEEVHTACPDLSVLINNASVFERAPLVDTEESLFDRQMLINFKIPYFLTRDFARLSGKGSVINFLDTKISKNGFVYSAYTLSKKALADFTKMAALELAPDIRVNGICPGVILPPPDKDESYLDNLINSVPLLKKGSTDDITNAVLFLLENEYLTGQFIFVDGGQSL